MPPPTATLSRRFFRLTFYNILANVTAPLVGLVDLAMLGHLSEIRFLAGVALGGVVFDVLAWTLGVLRMGTTGMTAQAFGRFRVGRRPETSTSGGASRPNPTEPDVCCAAQQTSAGLGEVYFILGRFLLLAAALRALLIALRSTLGETAFALLLGEPEVEAAGREYFDARILGVPAMVANLVFIGWFLGREESRRVLMMTAVANVVNIALNYLLIVRLGLAARGAGLASAASQYLMLAIAVWLFYRGRERGDVAWSWPIILERQRWLEMAHLNRDILIRTVLLVSSFAVFTNISSILGVAVLAANALMIRILTLAALLIDGAAFAVESLAGVLYGGGRKQELRRLVQLALISGGVFTVPFLLPLLLAPQAVLGLLTSHAEVIELGSLYRGWMVPVLLFGSVAYIHDGLFLGLTAGRALRNAMLISTLAVFFPLAFLALQLRGPNLLWLALAAFMLARGLTLEYARWSLPTFSGEDLHP